jgi:hypothetical protein
MVNPTMHDGGRANPPAAGPPALRVAGRGGARGVDSARALNSFRVRTSLSFIDLQIKVTDIRLRRCVRRGESPSAMASNGKKQPTLSLQPKAPTKSRLSGLHPENRYSLGSVLTPYLKRS